MQRLSGNEPSHPPNDLPASSPLRIAQHVLAVAPPVDVGPPGVGDIPEGAQASADEEATAGQHFEVEERGLVVVVIPAEIPDVVRPARAGVRQASRE